MKRLYYIVFQSLYVIIHVTVVDAGFKKGMRKSVHLFNKGCLGRGMHVEVKTIFVRSMSPVAGPQSYSR